MRRGRLALGVAALLLLADARAKPPATWDELAEPLPPLGFLFTPIVTTEHLALNIEGYTLSALAAGAYARMLRTRGQTIRREDMFALKKKDYSGEHESLLMYLAWLQEEVEHAPKPGMLMRDNVNRLITRPGENALGARKPVGADFKPRRREVPEHLRYEDAKLKPGELEFGSGKP